jgi:hypothetical protein
MLKIFVFSSFSLVERVRVEAANAEAQRLEAICKYNQQQMEKKKRLHQQQVEQMEID